MKKSAALILVFVIVLNVFPQIAFAETKSNAYITACGASISKPSSNTVRIDFNVAATDDMSCLGASTVILYKDGSPVKTFSRYDSRYTAYMVTTNSDIFYGHLSYSNASAGTYYAVVYFFATNETGTGYASYITSSITIP